MVPQSNFYYIDKLTVCRSNLEKAGNDVINILTGEDEGKMSLGSQVNFKSGAFSSKTLVSV